MTEVVSLEQALELAGPGTKHVLLGNGFSRACRNDKFAYGNLLERAEFGSLSSSARKAFDVLNTTDFEVVMEALKSASRLVALYDEDSPKLARSFQSDADGLREVLVSAIAESHPKRPAKIGEEEYAACKAFLTHFGNIYTLNYDLLLYWALMQDSIAPNIRCDDGFRSPGKNIVENWVVWDSSAHGQNVHYLHGALHVYEAGPEIQKYTWCNTGLALIDQIRAALKDEKYPLFVAEGSADQKMARINHSSFLGRAYRSFQNLGGSLFTYGLSFGDSDAHILRAIARSKVDRLFVSLYGPAESNREIIIRAEALVDQRKATSRRNGLEVRFYDAASAKVWG